MIFCAWPGQGGDRAIGGPCGPGGRPARRRQAAVPAGGRGWSGWPGTGSAVERLG